MHKCVSCGAEQPANTQFCGSCGHFAGAPDMSGPLALPVGNPSGYETSPYATSMIDVEPASDDSPTATMNALGSAHQMSNQYRTVEGSRPLPLHDMPTRKYMEHTTSSAGIEDEEEQDEDELLLFLPPNPPNTPNVKGTPQIQGAPMVHGTPPLGNGPPAQRIQAPDDIQGIGQQQLPLLQIGAEPIPVGTHRPHTHSAPTHASHPHHSPKRAGVSTHHHRSGCILWVTVALIVFVILGTLLGLVFVTPASLSLSGGGSASLGGSLTLHGSWYTPGSHVLLTLDGTIPLSAYRPTASQANNEHAQNRAWATSVELLHALQPDTTITVNALGTFDVTIIVGSDWQPGKHTIRASEQNGSRSATADVHLYEPTHLTNITPDHVSLGPVTEGDTKVVSTQVTLGTAGSDPIEWQASWDQNTAPWLQLDNTIDQIQAPDSQTITVSANPQGLKAGSYTATVTFTSSRSSDNLTLPVTLIIHPNTSKTPTFSGITPDTLIFNTITEGSSQSVSGQVTLDTSGQGGVQWQASWDQNKSPWLQLDHTSDTIQAPDSEQITVSVSPQGMPVGQHTAVVTFSSLQASKPLSLTVQVDVQSSTTSGDISSVTPTTATLGPVTEGYTQAATTSVALNTSGSGNVSWKASWDQSNAAWLQLSTTSGQIQAPTSQMITLSGATGLKAGTYTTNVVFTNLQSNKTVTLNVTFTVQAPAPELGSVDPNPLTLTSATQGYSQPVSGQVTLSTTGSGTLSWTATAGVKWIQLSSASGQIQAPGTQNVTVSASTGLQAGNYTGTVTFTNPKSGKQLALTVNFTVQAPPQLGISTNSIDLSTDCQSSNTGWICYVSLTNQSTTSSLTWSSNVSGNSTVAVVTSTNTIPASQSQRVEIDVTGNGGSVSDSVTFTGPANSQTVTLTYTPIS